MVRDMYKSVLILEAIMVHETKAAATLGLKKALASALFV